MSLPVCPSCGRSDTVASDPSNGGAGRNRCRCGHTAPVRDFHAPVETLRSRPYRFSEPIVDEHEPKPGEPGAPIDLMQKRRPRYWWQED